MPKSDLLNGVELLSECQRVNPILRSMPIIGGAWCLVSLPGFSFSADTYGHFSRLNHRENMVTFFKIHSLD